VVRLSGEQGVVLTYFGGACIVAELQGYTLVFDPADYLADEDIASLRGAVITLFTHHLDDHFHERTAMKLLEMKGSLIIGTSEVCQAVSSFVPSTKLVELRPRRGIRVGPLRIYALEGKHDVTTNIYYVTWTRSMLFAGDSGYVKLAGLNAPLAILSAGGSPHSTPESAARMALDVGASHVVPVHCSPEEARQLSELLAGRATVIVLQVRASYALTL